MAVANSILVLTEGNGPCVPSDGKEKYVRIERASEKIHDILALFGCLMLPGLGDRTESSKVTDFSLKPWHKQAEALTGQLCQDHYPERQAEMRITCKTTS